MEYGEANAGNSNHCALENHKRDFHVGNASVKAFAQFGNTVDGADVDGKGGYAES
jgi:hypothetical protein